MNNVNAENVLWNFSWDLEDRPVVIFQNPKLCSKVKYSAKELRNVLERTDEENDFIPVPRNVLQSALSVWEFQALDAA